MSGRRKAGAAHDMIVSVAKPVPRLCGGLLYIPYSEGMWDAAQPARLVSAPKAEIKRKCPRRKAHSNGIFSILYIPYPSGYGIPQNGKDINAR